MSTKNYSYGFSLVEFLFVMAIFLIIVGGATLLFKDTFNFNRNISDNLATNGEARRAIKTMSAQIRTASPSSLGAYALEQTSTSTFTFYSNIDADTGKERIRYFLSGNTLKQGIVEPAGSTTITYATSSETFSELAHNVVNSSTTPLFSYYTDLYAGTSSALVAPFDVSTVRLVKIQLLVNATTTGSSSPSVHSTQISFRNLKDNL